jgi:hypothetical protein
VDDLALLRLELETLWVRDDDGRLRHCRTAEAEPPPLLVVARGRTGLVCATSTTVPPEVGRAVARLLDNDPSPAVTGWAPVRADAVLEALAVVAALTEPHGGPSYVVDGALAAPGGVELRTSSDLDDASLPGLPATDRPLTAPWVAALAEGRVAAVCETARSAPSSVEAGVWTYPPYRRRGLAAAVTAAWSALVADRVAFYSTGWDNEASQGVARRLGLRPIGHWWQLS